MAWEHALQPPTGRCLIIAGRSKQIGPGLVVTTFRDVTDERAQARLRDRLLVEAQAANKLKDEFLATVTHEIRTPINAVVGWTHLLLNRRIAVAGVGQRVDVGVAAGPAVGRPGLEILSLEILSLEVLSLEILRFATAISGQSSCF